MKRFLINSTVFFVIFLAIFISLWLLLVSTRVKFCSTDAHILICGNSTVEYGVDDSLIPNSLNLGFNADHMDFIYAKIKMIRKYSPSVDTVLIAVDDALMKKDITEGYSSELHHPFYYDQYDVSDVGFLLKNVSLAWNESTISRPCRINHIITAVKSVKRDSISFKELGVGGYYKLDRHKLEDEINLNLPDQIPQPVSPEGDDKYAYSLYFLKKIKDFCDSNSMTLIFFTTPKHSFSQKFNYKRLCDEYFPHVRLLDFTAMPLPDSCFGDTYHLNTEGAQYFTPILYQAIKGEI